MPLNQAPRKDKSIVWTKTAIDSADIELASVPKKSIGDKSSSTRRRSSRRRKSRRKKTTCLDTLCVLNPAARTLSAVRREISEYVDSGQFFIQDWTLKFADEKEEEKFLEQWRGIGTLRLFSFAATVLFAVKYVSYQTRLKGHEAVAIIVSFTPCVCSYRK